MIIGTTLGDNDSRNRDKANMRHNQSIYKIFWHLHTEDKQHSVLVTFNSKHNTSIDKHKSEIINLQNDHENCLVHAARFRKCLNTQRE